MARYVRWMDLAVEVDVVGVDGVVQVAPRRGDTAGLLLLRPQPRARIDETRLGRLPGVSLDIERTGHEI